MFVLPSELLDVIDSMPAIVEKLLFQRVATEEAMSRAGRRGATRWTIDRRNIECSADR